MRGAIRAFKGAVLLRGVVMSGPRRPEIALTFDDGPSPEHTPPVLDALAARGARATFFVLGAHVEAHPELARRVAAAHEIGCHSYDHRREVVHSLGAFREDVDRCRRLLARELAVSPRWYRFPWGDPGRVAPRDVLALEGMRCVGWSASADEGRAPEAMAVALARALEPGAILLLHDGLAPGSVLGKPRRTTALGLPLLLDAVAAAGLRPVTLSELLGPGAR